MNYVYQVVSIPISAYSKDKETDRILQCRSDPESKD